MELCSSYPTIGKPHIREPFALPPTPFTVKFAKTRQLANRLAPSECLDINDLSQDPEKHSCGIPPRKRLTADAHSQLLVRHGPLPINNLREPRGPSPLRTCYPFAKEIHMQPCRLPSAACLLPPTPWLRFFEKQNLNAPPHTRCARCVTPNHPPRPTNEHTLPTTPCSSYT